MISIFNGIKTVTLLFLILACNNVKNNSEVERKKLDTIKNYNNTEDFFAEWIVKSYDEEIVIIAVANKIEPTVLKKIISDYLTKTSTLNEEKIDFSIILEDLSHDYGIEKEKIAKLILDFKMIYNEK